MGLTINDLRVGERLFFGEYGAGDSASPISWLKATRNNRFLSEFALDRLTYDAPEPRRPGGGFGGYRYCGSSVFRDSNIYQFLNSDEEDWYSPSHEFDEPPGNAKNIIQHYYDYINKPGFLYGFEGYEIESLQGKVGLPSTNEIRGVAQFELFKRKGIRAKMSEDFLTARPGVGFDEKSYAEYMTCSTDGEFRFYEINRTGYAHAITASSCCGIRPICDIKGSTEVRKRLDGNGYEIVPYEVAARIPIVCSVDDIKMLLGLQ